MIAAFDLASNTGFAWGRLGDHVPAFGSIQFGAAEAAHKKRFAKCLEWSSGFLKRNQIDSLIIEQPLHFGLRRGNSGFGNDELSYGFCAIVQAVAHLRGCLDVRQARVSDIRKFFLGHSPQRKDAKKQTVARCRALGLNVTDDDQADAVALWFYQSAQLRPQLGLRVSPLFNKAIAL